jgi:lipoyl(octanoyl) transferase
LILNVVHLGVVPYAVGLQLQAELVAARKAGAIANTLLLLEHAPVVTLGRNARRQNVLADEKLLAARGVELYECDRGGDVTFHGPGQLVGYPIVDLFGFTPRMGAVDLVRKMEEAIVRTCATFGIAAGRVKGLTGVWTRPDPQRRHGDAEKPEVAKIAAIGIHVSRGVTSHGFALNVNNDLDYFNLIVPCGIESRPVTSLARETGAERPLDDVAQAVARSFGQVFTSQIVWTQTVDELLGRKVGVPLQTPKELEFVEGERPRFA